MGLRIRQPWWLKTQGIVTLIAVLALVIQPIGGFVAGQVANAISGDTLYVKAGPGTDAGNDCTDEANPCVFLKTALSKASAGDTIDVNGGSYSGNFVIDKSLSLVGRNGASLNYSAADYTVRIAGDNSAVSIEGFNIENTGGKSAIKVPSEVSLSSLTLRNLDISATKAIYISDKASTSTIDSLTIENSIVSSNYPVYVEHKVGSVTMTGNTFNTTSSGNRGVVFAEQSASSSVNISGNTFNTDSSVNTADQVFVKYTPSDATLLSDVKDGNIFNINGASARVTVTSDGEAIKVDNSPLPVDNIRFTKTQNSTENVQCGEAVNWASQYINGHQFGAWVHWDTQPNTKFDFTTQYKNSDGVWKTIHHTNHPGKTMPYRFYGLGDRGDGQYRVKVFLVDRTTDLKSSAVSCELTYDATPPAITDVSINDKAVPNSVGNYSAVDMDNPYHVSDKFTVSAIYNDALSGFKKGNVDIANVNSKGNSNGNNGIHSTVVKEDLGNGRYKYTYTVDTDKITQDGVYMLKIRAWDKAGNPYAKHIAINVDRTAPSKPVITTPTPRKWFNTNSILNKWDAATDDNSGVAKYQVAYHYDDNHTFTGSTCDGESIDGVLLSGCRDESVLSRTHEPGTDEQGGVTIWVRAVDNAGNVGPWSKSVHYYYDHEAPKIMNFSYPTGVVNKIVVSGDSHDNMGFRSGRGAEIQLNNWTIGKRFGGVVVPGVTDAINPLSTGIDASWTYEYDIDQLGLPDGEYSVTAKLVDKIGNSSNIDWTPTRFTLDTTPPEVNIDPSLDGKVFNSTVSVTGSVTDAHPHHYWVQVKKDNKVISSQTINNPSNFNGTFATLSDEGEYEVTVAACDAAGGTSDSGNRSDDVTVKFTIDKTPPKATVSVDSVINPTKLTVGIEDSVDPQGTYATNIYNLAKNVIEVDTCDGAFANGQTTATCDISLAGLGDGEYWLKANVVDAAGNNSASVASNIAWQKIVVDNTPPNIPVITETLTNGLLKITVKPADTDGGEIDSVSITDVDGNPIAFTRDGDVYTVDTNGMYKNTKIFIAAVAKDIAGNTSSADANYTVNNGTPKVGEGSLSNDAEGNFTLNGTSGFGEGADVTVTVNGHKYYGTTVAGGAWHVDVGHLSANTRYTFYVTIANDLGYVNDTLKVTYNTPSVATEQVDAENTTVPVFTPGETTPVAVAGGESTEPTVLGTEDENAVKGDSTTKTAALTPSKDGWKLFGTAWYWWLLAIAAIVGFFWWLIGALRRRQQQEA